LTLPGQSKVEQIHAGLDRLEKALAQPPRAAPDPERATAADVQAAYEDLYGVTLDPAFVQQALAPAAPPVVAPVAGSSPSSPPFTSSGGGRRAQASAARSVRRWAGICLTLGVVLVVYHSVILTHRHAWFDGPAGLVGYLAYVLGSIVLGGAVGHTARQWRDAVVLKRSLRRVGGGGLQAI
jgi:hypothetical protein